MDVLLVDDVLELLSGEPLGSGRMAFELEQVRISFESREVKAYQHAQLLALCSGDIAVDAKCSELL